MVTRPALVLQIRWPSTGEDQFAVGAVANMAWLRVDVHADIAGDVMIVEVGFKIALDFGLGKAPGMAGSLEQVIHTAAVGKSHIRQIPLGAEHIQWCQATL